MIPSPAAGAVAQALAFAQDERPSFDCDFATSLAMDAAPQLILHIGLPKTGSSAIQFELARRREALSALGVHYASAGDDPLRLPGGVSSGNGVGLGRWLNPEKWEAGYDPAAVERGFARAFLSDAHPVCLISSEALAGAKHAQLVRLRDLAEAEGRTVRVVAFVRDLYDHAWASWLQRIKRGAYRADFAAFCRTAYDNPQYRTLRLFRKVLGPGAISAVHYDTVEGGVMGGFLGALGLPAGALPAPPRVNRSLSPEEAALLLRLNRLHRSPVMAHRISDALTLRRPSRPARAARRPELLEELTRRHADEVRWINDRLFGKREVWRIARERPEPPARGSRLEVLGDVAAATLQSLRR